MNVGKEAVCEKHGLIESKESYKTKSAIFGWQTSAKIPFQRFNQTSQLLLDGRGEIPRYESLTYF
jgi:hypothetical protein